MSAKSTILFGLRSNANALLQGAPANSVVGRIKIASLLHDRVLIEEGTWIGMAGERASSAIWHPPSFTQVAQLQAPRERRTKPDDEFYFLVTPSDAPPGTPGRPILRSRTTISWRATFEPLKRDLPRAFSWMEFGHAEPTNVGKKVISRWNDVDKVDPGLHEAFPEQFVRGMLVDSANTDLFVGSQLGAAVSLDRFHKSLVMFRLMRGEAKSVLGHKTLDILVPKVTDLDWNDIDEVRKHKDLNHLRAVLRDIEAEALESATSLNDLPETIRSRYEEKLREAQARVEGTWGRWLTRGLIGSVVGEAVGVAFGVPMVGGAVGIVVANAAGEAVGLGIDRLLGRRDRVRWVSADNALRVRVQSRAHDQREPIDFSA
ncbi:MAG: hypothetical protein AB7R89_09230 [Dehalococcoidia bacterium]